ncbi:MAG: hypothetical protein QNJ38_01415 [Prochloraceae cyanobacterium]|nr:hypothetical protein [Prochloraceae cyanobacterium]
MTYRYNTLTGEYTDDRGNKVSTQRISAIIESERRFLERKIKSQTEQLIKNDATVFEWERSIQAQLKQSHLKLAALGAGGKNGITPRHRGQLGAALRQEYNLLFDFRKDIQAGKLSEKQILNRARFYSRSVSQSYYRSQQLSRAMGGATLAKRELDPTAKHCPECPKYVTNGFVPIEQVVPTGTRCSCRGNCKCRVIYRLA